MKTKVSNLYKVYFSKSTIEPLIVVADSYGCAAVLSESWKSELLEDADSINVTSIVFLSSCITIS